MWRKSPFIFQVMVRWRLLTGKGFGPPASCSSQRPSASSALTSGVQTHRSLDKGQRDENLENLPEAHFSTSAAQSYILILHSIGIPNLAPSLVQLRDTWPQKPPLETPFYFLRDAVEHIICYKRRSLLYEDWGFCLKFQHRDLVYMGLTGPVQCRNWSYLFLCTGD